MGRLSISEREWRCEAYKWWAFLEARGSNGPLTTWRDLRESLLSVALQESLEAAALARVHREVGRVRYLVDKHAYVVDEIR